MFASKEVGLPTFQTNTAVHRNFLIIKTSFFLKKKKQLGGFCSLVFKLPAKSPSEATLHQKIMEKHISLRIKRWDTQSSLDVLVPSRGHTRRNYKYCSVLANFFTPVLADFFLPVLEDFFRLFWRIFSSLFWRIFHFIWWDIWASPCIR